MGGNISRRQRREEERDLDKVVEKAYSIAQYANKTYGFDRMFISIGGGKRKLSKVIQYKGNEGLRSTLGRCDTVYLSDMELNDQTLLLAHIEKGRGIEINDGYNIHYKTL